MFKLIGVFVVLAILWCGWWAFASATMQRGIANWLETRRALGWQVDVRTVEKRGFPLQLHARINDLTLADPASGAAVKMDELNISSPTYWPGYVTVVLPQTPIALTSAELRGLVTARDAKANLRLRPGASLQLERLGLTAAAWSLDTALSGIVGANTLDLTMIQPTSSSATYDIKLEASDLTPGMIPRAFLGLPADWPLTFDVFAADMTVTFDRLWDRRALGQIRPQPRMIDLKQAHAIWGDVEILASGNVVVDQEGLATGTVSIKAENWPAILDMVENAGYLPPNMRPQAEQMLTGLAQMTGQTTGLDLTLSLKEGRMSMGFIPLGRAPRIILR